MKKVLFFMLLIVMVFSLTSTCFANEGRFQEPTQAQKDERAARYQALLDSSIIPSSISVNGNVKNFNMEYAKRYDFIVYGSRDQWSQGECPAGFPDEQEVDGYGEYRYLGYTIGGQPFYNPWVQDDIPNPRPMWNLASGDAWVNPSTIEPDPVYNNQAAVWGDNGTGESNPWVGGYKTADCFYENGQLVRNVYIQSIKASLEEVKKLEESYISSGYVQNLNDKSIENSYTPETMRSQFSIISLRTQYTPFIIIGRHLGGEYYRTWSLPPLGTMPDLSINIVKTGYENSGANETGTYTAEFIVKLESDKGWDQVKKSKKQIPIQYWVARKAPSDTSQKINTADWHEDINVPLDIDTMPNKEYKFSMQWDKKVSGEQIYLRGQVNPEKTTGSTKARAINETTYTNNYAEKSVAAQAAATESVAHSKYKYYEYYYTPVKTPVTINDGAGFDENRLYTYKNNTIVMQTSTDTQKIVIDMNKYGNHDFKLVLNTNNTWDLLDGSTSVKSKGYINYLNETTNQKSVTGANMLNVVTSQIKAAETDTASGAEKYDSLVESKKIWTFKFCLKNYAIFPEPIANDTQYFALKFTAYDDLGQVDKGSLGEKNNPMYAYVNVRQIKLFNLRVTNVKDVYWKDVFNNANGTAVTYSDLRDSEKAKPPFGVKKMPLKNNSINKRLISKGYAVEFKVDSEGLTEANDRLIIDPSYWWYDSNAGRYREADLYYDIPDKGLYNVPIQTYDLAIKSDAQASAASQTRATLTSDLETKLAKILQLYSDYNQKQKARQTFLNNMLQNYSFMVISPNNPNNNKTISYASKTFKAEREALSVGGKNIFLNGRKSWEFLNNTIGNLMPNQDNYRKGDSKLTNVRNTWTFTFSLHPKTKAYIKGADPMDQTNHPLTGPILVNLKILTVNSIDSGVNGSSYNYTKFEDTWDSSIPSGSPLRFNTGNDVGNSGHGDTFYYNLDSSVLNDYSMQQNH